MLFVSCVKNTFYATLEKSLLGKETLKKNRVIAFIKINLKILKTISEPSGQICSQL